MTKKAAVMLGIAAILSLSSAAHGQEAPPSVAGICGGPCMAMSMAASGPCFQPPGPEGRHRGGGQIFRGRRERLEKLRMEKMIEVLHLSPQQHDKMVELFKKHREERDRLFEERGKLMEEMREVVHAEPFDERAAAELIGKYENLERRQFEHRGALMKEVKDLLSVEQQARMILFQENFEENIMRAIHGLRDSAGNPPEGPDDNKSFRQKKSGNENDN